MKIATNKLMLAADILVLAVLFFYLSSFFNFSVIFDNRTTNGGDTGSHYYPAQYMKDYLLPHLKITGWCPGWYAGFPIFQFYFPLSYVLMALISYPLGLNIAFRIVSCLGVFLLPVCTYFFFRIMKVQFPGPAIAAVLTIPFLFLETNSYFGGNIPSVLAGEFAESISISLSLFFLGLMYKGIEKKKLIVPSALVLGLVMMFHLVPGIICILASGFFILFTKDRVKNFIYLFKVFALAFLLIGFWAVPFILKMSYSTSMNYTPDHAVDAIFPVPIIAYYIIAFAGAFFFYRDDKLRFFLFIILACLFFYLFMPQGHLVNFRFIPFVYLFVMFTSALVINNVLHKFRIKYLMFVPIIILIIILLINQNTVSYIPSWIKWNYDGYEAKADNGFLKLNEYLKTLPDGRIMYEYSSGHNSLGSSRAFETIPAFSGKPVMEGLFIESALSAQAHFILQPELSEGPSCPIAGMPCPPNNIKRGLEHMKLFNIKYYIATTNKLKQLAKNNSEFKFLKSVSGFDIFELDNSGYVVAAKEEPGFFPEAGWRQRSIDWMIKGDLAKIQVYGAERPSGNLNYSSECKIEEHIENEKIEFNTTCIGRPHLIKVSYFPNWKVNGADKVYLASPSFMLVYPTQSHVEIYYGLSYSDWLGIAATAAGILIAVSIALNLRFFGKLYKKQ
jgi:uncharacterized membrane protein